MQILYPMEEEVMKNAWTTQIFPHTLLNCTFTNSSTRSVVNIHIIHSSYLSPAYMMPCKALLVSQDLFCLTFLVAVCAARLVIVCRQGPGLASWDPRPGHSGVVLTLLTGSQPSPAWPALGGIAERAERDTEWDIMRQTEITQHHRVTRRNSIT